MVIFSKIWIFFFGSIWFFLINEHDKFSTSETLIIILFSVCWAEILKNLNKKTFLMSFTIHKYSWRLSKKNREKNKEWVKSKDFGKENIELTYISNNSEYIRYKEVPNVHTHNCFHIPPYKKNIDNLNEIFKQAIISHIIAVIYFFRHYTWPPKT